MIGGFEFTAGLLGGIWLVMESAVCQGAAESFVKEEEQDRDVNALSGQPVGISSSIALE